MITVYSPFAILIVLLLVSLGWRWASQRWQIPFPAWLSWLFLDNPLAERIAGTDATIARIGLERGEDGLDIGCGTGRLSIPAAAKVGPTGTIVAYDIQPAMLARLQRRFEQAGISNITTQLGDITTDEHLPPDAFDRAWLARY